MKRALLLGGRVVLGGVFVYAAYTKLVLHWTLFAFSINSYHILPEWGVEFLARTLPWFELILGLALLAGVGLRYVAAVASGLLLFFFAVMLRAHLKGQGIDCGCFGFGEAISGKTLLRDGVLILLAIGVTIGAWRKPDERRPAAQASAGLEPQGASHAVE